MINHLTLLLTCVNLGVSLIGICALIIAILAYIKAASIEKSTHTVQLMPTEEITGKSEGWETSEKEIAKINKESKDEVFEDFESLSI